MGGTSAAPSTPLVSRYQDIGCALKRPINKRVHFDCTGQPGALLLRFNFLIGLRPTTQQREPPLHSPRFVSLGLLVCRVVISQHDDCDLLRPRTLRSRRIAVYAVLCLKIRYALGMGFRWFSA